MTMIELVGTALGSSVLTTAIGGVVAVATKKRDSADKRDEALLNGMSQLVETLQGALDRNVARADQKAKGEADALRLVAEMSGRIEDMEVRTNRLEVQLEDSRKDVLKCHEERATERGAAAAMASDIRALRARMAELEKRPSQPAIAAVGR